MVVVVPFVEELVLVAIVGTVHVLQDVNFIAYIVNVILVVEEMRLLNNILIVLDIARLLLVRPQADCFILL